MAIRDLLWACPLCKSEGALQPARAGEVCRACGTHYARGPRATITARSPGRPLLAMSPTEWVDRLPGIDIAERIRKAGSRAGIVHREPAILRTEIGDEPVAFRGIYLNRIERFGPPRAGILLLETDRVTFHAEGDTGSAPTTSAPSDTSATPTTPEESITWAFDAISAVQPSSGTLQIKAGGLPLASLQVPNGSIRFWDELLCAALRAHYLATGRGEIIEFQPRITTGQAS